MAKGSLRRYDVQAKIALYVSCVAVVCVLGLAMLLMRNYKPEMSVIGYGKKSIYGPLVYGLTALAMLTAGTGAAMGAVSAGQKRNTFSKRSWTAFFMGGFCISLTIVLFYMFFTLGFAG